MLIELCTPIGLVLLYQYINTRGLDPSGILTDTQLMVQLVAYGLLMGLMVIATFIDFDERTIPDMITLPGTLIGLVGSTWVPGWRLWLPGATVFPPRPVAPIALHANSPFGWPVEWKQGAVGASGLWIGILIWVVWCFAMMERRLILRRGYSKAGLYFLETLRRSPTTRPLMGLGVVGSIAIAVGYYGILSPPQWEGLLSSLMGIGLGGLLVWLFRIVAYWGLEQEALGFGDVTLMGMVGAFFGWQIVWVAFFFAPVLALVFVISIWIITGNNRTPFGPYLCGATLYLMLDWNRVWEAIGNPEFFPSLNILFLLLAGLLIGLLALLRCIQLFKKMIGIRV